MKSWIGRWTENACACLVALALLASLGLPSASALAQPLTTQDEVAAAKARLKLSPEQEAEMRSLLQQERERLKAIEGSTGSRLDKARELRDMQQDFRGRLEKILDKQQLAEWDRMRDELRKRVREREQREVR